MWQEPLEAAFRDLSLIIMFGLQKVLHRVFLEPFQVAPVNYKVLKRILRNVLQHIELAAKNTKF